MTSCITTKEFIKRAKLLHGNRYDYSKVKYVGAYVPVVIICKEHGQFSQVPHYHLDGCGCTICGWRLRARKKTQSLQSFIGKFKKTHGDRYDYSSIHRVDTTNKVEIICKKHGVFSQLALNHIKGVGCPLCYRDLHTREGFIKRAIKIHGGKYDYSLIPDKHLGSSEKLTIICRKHGPFTQQKRAHIVGQGCPSCKSFMSRSEKRWLASLHIRDLKRQYRLKDLGINVDGYSPSKNTVYEFYGDFWHANPSVFDKNLKHPMLKGTFGDVYSRTLERERKIRSAGYNLVSIWEADWRNQ